MIGDLIDFSIFPCKTHILMIERPEEEVGFPLKSLLHFVAESDVSSVPS